MNKSKKQRPDKRGSTSKPATSQPPASSAPVQGTELARLFARIELSEDGRGYVIKEDAKE